MNTDKLFDLHKRNIDSALNTMLVDYVKRGVPAEKILTDLMGVCILSLGFAGTQRMSMLLQIGEAEENIADKVHSEIVSIMNSDGFAHIKIMLQERLESVKEAIAVAHASVAAGGTGVAFIRGGKVESDVATSSTKTLKDNLH